MSEKVYLHLLILCGIVSHVIAVSSLSENNKESSNLLLRKKRVLNRESGGDVAVRIADFQYVVQIKKHNRVHCAGSILSTKTVITVAECVFLEVDAYTVSSGVIRTSRGKLHDVTGKKTYFSSIRPREKDGVALITVDPPFVFSQFTHKINLHEEILLPNTIGIVAGWGCLKGSGSNRGTIHPELLRAINVPIISHRECVNSYRNYANITDKEICTYDANKYCGHTDSGAPLVLNDKLVAIELWGGHIVNYKKPDVFLLVQHPEFKNWIMANIV